MENEEINFVMSSWQFSNDIIHSTFAWFAFYVVLVWNCGSVQLVILKLLNDYSELSEIIQTACSAGKKDVNPLEKYL